jgi:hypothetical protein
MADKKKVPEKQVVINGRYGGFCLTNEQMDLLGIDDPRPTDKWVRTDPRLVQNIIARDHVENWGRLKVVTIPYNAFWEIRAYDGKEWITWSESPLNTVE